MKKSVITLFLLTLFFTNQSAKADSIMLADGSVVKGRIENVLSGLIEVKTKDGFQKIMRPIGEGEARDILEVGLFMKKRILGEVYFANDQTVEVATPTGNLEINRFWVRNIILSQQTPLEKAPHN